MNFDKLFTWIISIVIGFAAVGKVDTLQRWIWIAQAKVVAESRTSNWGSPRFFRDNHFTKENSNNDSPRSERSKGQITSKQ
jgi:hypothetical protein